MRPRHANTAVLLLAALAASGCASLADRIAEPRGLSLLEDQAKAELVTGLRLVPGSVVTPEGVRIAYIEVPAIRRQFLYELKLHGGAARFGFRTTPTEHPGVPQRGSIVYLHGWGMDGSSLWPWALTFAERGYRGYVLDLRNHGRSDRAPQGFGPREAVDVVSVVEQLARAGKLPSPVFLFGVSMGATTALFTESSLQGSLAGIIALEPYANAAEAVRGAIASVLALPADGSRASLRQRIARRRYGSENPDRVIAELDRRLGLALARIDLAPVVAGFRTCTLLLHGADDDLLDPAASVALAAESPLIQLHVVPGMDHIALPLRVDWFAAPMIEWLAASAAGRCEPMALAPDPLSH